MGELDRAIAAFQEKDYVTARTLLAQVADKTGDAHAHYLFATMNSFGQGGEPNLNEAVRHYTIAAEAGHAIAQYCLAALYAQGRGVAQDYGEALRWYRRAAEGGEDRKSTRLNSS